MFFKFKKENLMKIFWLLFFILFFYTPIKKFNFFSVSITQFEGRGAPLLMILFEFLKTLVTTNRFLPLIASIFLILLAMLLLLFISFFIAGIIEKLNLNRLDFLKKIDNLMDKILDIKPAYIILFLFFISIIPRLLYMNAGLFHNDSVETAIATEETLKTGKLQGIVGYRYGYVMLNVLAYFIPHFVFGMQSAEVVVNILTIILASFSIAVMYLFVKELSNNKYVAFGSSLIFSFSSLYFSITLYAKDHAASVLFILLAGYFLLKSLKTDLFRFKILFAIFLGFSLFIRISDVFVTLPVFLILYIFPEKFLGKDAVKLKKLELKNLIFIWLLFILALVLFFAWQRGAVSKGIASNQFLEGKIDSSRILDIAISLTPLGSFLTAYGLFISARKRPFLCLLLFIWLLIVLIFYSSFATSRLRFFVLMFVPLAVIMGICLDYIKENFRVVSYVLLVALLLLSFLLIKPVISYRHLHSSGKELGLFAVKYTEPNAVIIDAGDHGLFYKYYAKRGFIQCPSEHNSSQFNDFINEVNSSIARKIPVYFNDRCIDIPPYPEKFLIFDALTNYYEFSPVGDVNVENYEQIYILNKYKFTIYKVKKR